MNIGQVKKTQYIFDPGPEPPEPLYFAQSSSRSRNAPLEQESEPAETFSRLLILVLHFVPVSVVACWNLLCRPLQPSPRHSVPVSPCRMSVDLYTFGWALGPPNPEFGPSNVDTSQTLMKQVTLTRQTPESLLKTKHWYYF